MKIRKSNFGQVPLSQIKDGETFDVGCHNTVYIKTDRYERTTEGMRIHCTNLGNGSLIYYLSDTLVRPINAEIVVSD